MKTYSDKSNARRAAKKALTVLGCADPAVGEDFTITETDSGKFTYKVAEQWMPQTEDDAPQHGPSPAAQGIAAAKADDEAKTAVETAINGFSNATTIEQVDSALLAATTAIGNLPNGADTYAAWLRDLEDFATEARARIAADDLDVTAMAQAAGTLATDAPAPAKGGKRAEAAAKSLAKAQAGDMERLVILSPKNQSYQKRADALLALAEAGEVEELAEAPITGTNTYANMLRRYRDLLVIAAKARAAGAEEAAQ